MKAMILAAGFGTRLRPLTDHLPKPMLLVGGQPLIHYNLLLLKKYGITDVMINVHYQADKITQSLGNGATFGMNITYAHESSILGTGGGLKNVEDYLGEGAFLVMNSDILVDLDLDKLVEFHHRKGGAATLALRHNPDLTQYGLIEVDATDKIRNILKKVPPQKGRTRKRMFTGIHVLEPRVLDYIPPGRFYSIIEAYVDMLKKEEPLYGYEMTGYWAELGVLSEYESIHHDMRAGKITLSYMRHGHRL